MRYRVLTKTIHKALGTFSALVVTGPRQSGKTTLLKNLLNKTHSYVNLDDPDTRMRAKDDPRGFLMQHSPPVVIDEIQYVPELLSYIKVMIDENRKPGNWVITGSQNFVLMQGVSESLAGRAAILSLLSFSYSENIGQGEKSLSVSNLLKRIFGKSVEKGRALPVDRLLLRGSFPEIASNPKVDRNLWCGSYISSYLERDVRNLANVGDLNQFERFLRICAVRTGQILNLSELAGEIGISVPTATKWISMLETGYQVYLLYPYFKNIGKRIIKRPKLYFNDTALACYLLGIKDTETLLNSPYFPHIFETLIVTDFWKRFLHFGEIPSMFYLRTRDGLELDLVIESNQKLFFFEIKSSSTIYPRHAVSLIRAKNDFQGEKPECAVISRSPQSFPINRDVLNFCWTDLLSF